MQAVLAEHGVAEPVELVTVESADDAQRLRFPGSPTLRVDGRDVEPDPPSDYSLECRIYWVDGRPVGVPTREWMVDAVSFALASPPLGDRTG